MCPESLAPTRSILVIVWHLQSDPTARYRDLGSDTTTTASVRTDSSSDYSRQVEPTTPAPDADPRPQVDRITDMLREAILFHEFAPGEKLRAVQLAERFCTSPTPVRESLARLAGEGLVTYSPQRGARVAELSQAEMVDVYEIRALLEPLALRRSLARATPDWTVAIMTTHRGMEDALGHPFENMSAPEYATYERRHLAFHKALLNNCGSRWLLQFTSLLAEQSSRFRRLSLDARGGHTAVSAEHHAILRACQALDPDAAVAALQAHMTRTQTAIRDMFPS
jgi:GntR family carbon starvation induced transcriptional regulator